MAPLPSVVPSGSIIVFGSFCGVFNPVRSELMLVSAFVLLDILILLGS